MKVIMTSLTFYGGVNEIGGNKILLKDKDTKVFLDFGMSFGKSGKFFEEFISPRVSSGITDCLARGLFPVHTENPDTYKKVATRRTSV